MKPAAHKHETSSKEYERFEELTRKLVAVSKDEIKERAKTEKEKKDEPKRA